MMTTQPTTLAPATAADEDVDIDDAALADLQHGGIKPKESLRIAFGSLVSNKLRSLLTALGVIIGVTMIMAGRGKVRSLRTTAVCQARHSL